MELRRSGGNYITTFLHSMIEIIGELYENGREVLVIKNDEGEWGISVEDENDNED